MYYLDLKSGKVKSLDNSKVHKMIENLEVGNILNFAFEVIDKEKEIKISFKPDEFNFCYVILPKKNKSQPIVKYISEAINIISYKVSLDICGNVWVRKNEKI